MKKRRIRVGVKIVFWIYLILLFAFVILKFDGAVQLIRGNFPMSGEAESSFNLVPLASIKNYWATKTLFVSKMNLIGNTLPFIPFGILLPLSDSQKRFGWVILSGLLFVLCCEVVQYFTGFGTFDIDDIILNMCSIIAGYLLWGIGHLFSKVK